MEKLKGVLAYLFGWLGGLIVFFISEGNTKFHAAQSITLNIVSIIGMMVLGVISGILGMISGILAGIVGLITLVFSIYILVLCISGIIKVIADKEPELTLVGNLTHSIFKI